jgi:hypothetical protein
MRILSIVLFLFSVWPTIGLARNTTARVMHQATKPQRVLLKAAARYERYAERQSALAKRKAAAYESAREFNTDQSISRVVHSEVTNPRTGLLAEWKRLDERVNPERGELSSFVKSWRANRNLPEAERLVAAQRVKKEITSARTKTEKEAPALFEAQKLSVRRARNATTTAAEMRKVAGLYGDLLQRAERDGHTTENAQIIVGDRTSPSSPAKTSAALVRDIQRAHGVRQVASISSARVGGNSSHSFTVEARHTEGIAPPVELIKGRHNISPNRVEATGDRTRMTLNFSGMMPEISAPYEVRHTFRLHPVGNAYGVTSISKNPNKEAR